MMTHTILFDLDDTLYPRQTGVMHQIGLRMVDFIRAEFHLDEEQALALRRKYFVAYGTTLRGLQINHQIDANRFLDFVHDIPLEEFLGPNPRLDAVLSALPQRKVIFTNASREHASAVLAILGISRHFDRIFDIRDMEYQSKPHPSAYRRICELLSAHPEECILVEDNLRNIEPARALGMTTVLVGDSPHDGAVDYVIPTIEEIDRVIAQLQRT